MNRNVIFALLWVLSLAIFFLFGRSSLSPETVVQTESERVVEERLVRTVEFVPRDSLAGDFSDDEGEVVFRTGDEDGPAGSAAYGVSRSEISRMLPSALSSNDRIAQNLVVAHMLSQITAENAQSMLAEFEKAEGGYMSDHHFRMFMYAWAEVDGKAAAEYAWNNPDPERRRVGYSGTWAMTAWAQQDPAAAFDFMEAQEDRGLAAKMHQGFMTGYARANLTEARGYAASMEKGKMRGAAVETLLKEHMKQVGPSGTLGWAAETLSSGGDPEYIKYVMGKATMEASRDENGRLLANFVDRNRDSEYITSQMFEEAADEWAESNPSAAVAWLERHFDDKRVTSAVVDEVADEWAKTDPARASAWIESQLDNPLVTDKVTGRAAGEWAASDPLGAADWVASLPDSMQAKSNEYVARQWPNDRLDEAVQWVDADRSPALDSARESIADRIDGRDPQEAIRLSNSISDPKLRERSLVRSAQSMYRQNKESVVAWLPVSGLSADAQQQVLRRRR